MKKRQLFPAAAVAAILLILFFSRSLYTMSLPHVLGEEAWPGHLTCSVPVSSIRLEGSDILSLPIFSAETLPAVGSIYSADEVMIPMTEEEAVSTRRKTEKKLIDLRNMKIAFENAVTANARSIRQSEASAAEYEAYLADDCASHPEIKMMNDNLKYYYGKDRTAYLSQIDERQKQLIVQYTDMLEETRERLSGLTAEKEALNSGFFADSSMSEIEKTMEENELLLSMLRDDGIHAAKSAIVASVSHERIALLPADAAQTAVIETGRPAFTETGATAELTNGITSVTLGIRSAEETDSGMRYTFDLPSGEIPKGSLYLKLTGISSPCVIPESAITGSGVYKIESYTSWDGAEHLTLRFTPVTIHCVSDGFASVEGGITAGEKVATVWDRNIYDGQEAVWAD